MDTQNDNEQRAILAGGCFALAIALMVLLLAMCGCRTTKIITDTVVKTDTVLVKRDSVIIRNRIDTVKVTLPQSAQMVEISVEHDTVSVLTDKYYTSTAAVFGGRLRHSLRSNPGATLTGAAVVHDTIKISVDSTMINNQSSHSQIKEVPVNHLYWWQKALMCVGILALILLVIDVFIMKK